ncbi:hypothetical protein EYF80_000069 [Liparis tanakae]|uniref:Uncharacterized protein n=1 Tax=Liparis tanakae TaxID=230148 RepID=A0A4Z2JGQ4_9TELE|nr:hypothetical protein EYF80_000069 [Liparis tanakae]
MAEKLLYDLFSNSRTELAVLASSPVVGSSRKRTEGSVISSMAMFILFFSPPEIPRVNVRHLGETQFFNEVIDSRLLFARKHGAGQPQCCRKTQILPHSQDAHDYIFLLRGDKSLRSKKKPLLSGTLYWMLWKLTVEPVDSSGTTFDQAVPLASTSSVMASNEVTDHDLYVHRPDDYAQRPLDTTLLLKEKLVSELLCFPQAPNGTTIIVLLSSEPYWRD